MTTRTATLCTLALLSAACSQPAGPPLTVSNVFVVAPMAGQELTSAYLTFDNNSDKPVTIVSITSPAFRRIEMHETVITDDIVRMRPLPELEIEEHSTIVFEPGGKHLMLFGAQQALRPGLSLTMDFHDSANGLVSVTTTVRARSELRE